MTDVRELMARFGPTTVKFDTGRGGTGGMSTQDIAAALAYVEPGLGKELLQALWWPDAGSRRGEQLRREVIGLVAPEYNKQMAALTTARIEFGIARTSMGWCGGPVTDVQRKEVQRAERALEMAAAAAWPVSTMEQLGRLTSAVIAELASCGCCKACGGLRVEPAPDGTGVIECSSCNGLGIERLSGRNRAASIGSDKSAYRRFWQPVYEWMLAHMRAAELRAADSFGRALNKAA